MHLLLTQQFRRIDRAYKVLTDPLMRQAYDLYGERVRTKNEGLRIEQWYGGWRDGLCVHGDSDGPPHIWNPRNPDDPPSSLSPAHTHPP